MTLVLAFALAGLTLTGLFFGLRLSPLASVGYAIVVFFLFLFLSSSRRPVPKLEGKGPAKPAKARTPLMSELYAEAEPAVGRLRQAAKEIRDAALRQRYEHLATVAQAILDALDADPENLSRVRRFMIYYLPRAADLAEGAAVLSKQTNPDVKRFRDLVELTGRLDEAFTAFSDSMVDYDLERLDLEMKLMKDALDEDFAHRRRPDSGSAPPA